MSRLLDHQLDHIATNILEFLDPGSLHQAKLVCFAWCNFIQDRLWGRKSTRKRLQARHLCRWKNGLHDEKEWRVACRKGEHVVSIACDDWILVAGLDSGLAKVYSLETGTFINLLNCRDDYYDLGPSQEENLVYVDVGEYLIATVTSMGVIVIRNKVTYALIYKESHHRNEPLHIVKIATDLIITSGRQEVVVLIHKRLKIGVDDTEYVQETCRFSDSSAGVITHVDSDGSKILIGTSRYILLWDVKEQCWLNKIQSGFINSLILHFPFAFTVGAGPSGGVWNLITGDMLRNFGDRYYSHLCCNGRFLSALESDRNIMLRDVVFFGRMNFQRKQVAIFDIYDLCDVPENDEEHESSDEIHQFEWRNDIILKKTESPSIAINRSYLAAQQGNFIRVLKFSK